MTPEAYLSLKEWMDFRASYGEKITGDSFLMRDLWQTTNIDYGAKWGLATHPKNLKSSGIKRLIERALWEQGIRQPLTRRYEDVMNGKVLMDLENSTRQEQNRS